MVPSLVKKIGAGVVVCAVCFSAGRYFGPTKVETKVVEKIVYQEKQATDKERNVERNTRETRYPDGTIVKETTQSRNTRVRTETEVNLESQRSEQSKVTARPDWRVGFTYQPPIMAFQDTRYSIRVERQLFSEIYVGLEAGSQRTVGLSLSIGF